MYRAQIEIGLRGRNKVCEVGAILDTGFTGGLWLPRTVAEGVGATFVRPVRHPKTVDGRTVRGSATVLAVRIVDANMEIETPAFCPSAEFGEVLVGAYLLASVDAVIVIGKATYVSPMHAKKNREKLFDFGDWVLPTSRAVTQWW